MTNWMALNRPEILNDPNVYGWHAKQDRRSERFSVEIRTERQFAVNLPKEIDGIKIEVYVGVNRATML